MSSSTRVLPSVLRTQPGPVSRLLSLVYNKYLITIIAYEERKLLN